MRVSAQLPAFVVVVVAASVVGLAGPVRAQSLGEVGRQEEQRRQNLKNPAKVLTNKDLNTARAGVEEPVAGQPQPGAASAPAAPPAAAEPPKTDGPAKDQKYWSTRKKEIDAKLERDRVLADAMQSRINGLTADFAARSDPAQRAVIERDRQRAVAELAGLQKSIKDGQKAVTDLDEEARKAGVPPGWLR